MSLSSYDQIGRSYARTRRADARIQAAIDSALGEARTIINVGAGTGSYEPSGRDVVAVEPSGVMVSQRPTGSAPVVRAAAESLPFPDASFDAALAVLTIHHWKDWRRGLTELRRVARGQVVLLTWDPEGPAFWLMERYFPEFLDRDRARFATMKMLQAEMGNIAIHEVRIPEDCTDGFLGAYWKRPNAYLDPRLRAGMSIFSDVDSDDGRLRQLAEDLRDGTWDRRFCHLESLHELDIGYRLVVSHAGASGTSS